MKKNLSERGRIIVETILGVVFFVALTYISGFVFQRFDLTAEKRHTLTPTTIDMLEGLEDVVYIKVFLDGEFPADFQRLQQSVKEKLDEMRAYAGENIQYEFINPSEAPDKKSREAMYGELIEKGLQYSSLQIRENDGMTEKIVFPGALVSYKDREIPLQILKNQQRVTDAELVNRTINNLEYDFVNAIYQVQATRKNKVAILQGHGELRPIEMKDFSTELSRYYDVNMVEIEGEVDALSRNLTGSGNRENRFDALVIAKPVKEFSEQDKYIIDQFVMYGGKVLWMIDPMAIAMDSLRTTDLTMSTPLYTNLDDQLFTYGVRLNKDLLIDRTCAPIALETGSSANPRTELFPWYFRPILVPNSPHPIAANVDPILTNFVSSIDTVERADVTKRVILTTSQYTRILKSPVRVSLNIVSINPDFGNANRPFQPVAYLLEGNFKSNFANRLPPNFLEERTFGFKENSVFTRMLVVSDGDIARNEVSRDGTQSAMLGWDPVLKRQLYGNREFLINAMNYLLGDASLINVRSRTIQLRKLDSERIVSERHVWQGLNIALPVALTLIFGLIQWMVRRNRYANK